VEYGRSTPKKCWSLVRSYFDFVLVGRGGGGGAEDEARFNLKKFLFAPRSSSRVLRESFFWLLNNKNHKEEDRTDTRS